MLQSEDCACATVIASHLKDIRLYMMGACRKRDQPTQHRAPHLRITHRTTLLSTLDNYKTLEKNLQINTIDLQTLYKLVTVAASQNKKFGP
ncbi:hypothetical protein AVEN_132815-1 [Araneus ventricosus]|uniref:Uncharacterized protein n=1 Tax=Araneus ventricosus TaxID=182803 RepID=A0A4Y2LLT0_ARAVE|nr:hypothetical protein AVEN_132815-1 [Araneus ventricosus]